MAGLGIISNPYSRVCKNDKHYNAKMWYELAGQGQFEVTTTTEDVLKTCLMFKQKNFDTIGLVGGDGSIGLCLSVLEKIYGPETLGGDIQNLPKILILRGGTFNVLAGNLGIHGTPLDLLNDYLQEVRLKKSIQTVAVRSLKVADRTGFLYADGLATAFLNEFYQNKGHASKAALLLTKTIADAFSAGFLFKLLEKFIAPQSVSLQLNDSQNEIIRATNTLNLVSTLPFMPFGIPLFKLLKNRPLASEFITFDITKKMDFVIQAFRAISGQNFSHRKIESFVFDKVTIKKTVPFDYSLDGELFKSETQSLNIRTGTIFHFCSLYGNKQDRKQELII